MKTIEESADKVNAPKGLDSNIENALYWSNGTITTYNKFYILSVITMYSDMDGPRSTPQYGFSMSLKESKEERYNIITVSKLNNNLIKMNAVKMLDKNKITNDIYYYSAFSYLVFLKR